MKPNDHEFFFVGLFKLTNLISLLVIGPSDDVFLCWVSFDGLFLFRDVSIKCYLIYWHMIVYSNSFNICNVTSLLFQISVIWVFSLWISVNLATSLGFPACSAGKESACNTGDPGLIPGLGRSTGEGISYPLQLNLCQFCWAFKKPSLIFNAFFPPLLFSVLYFINFHSHFYHFLCSTWFRHSLLFFSSALGLRLGYWFESRSVVSVDRKSTRLNFSH